MEETIEDDVLLEEDEDEEDEDEERWEIDEDQQAWNRDQTLITRHRRAEDVLVAGDASGNVACLVLALLIRFFFLSLFSRQPRGKVKEREKDTCCV